MVLADALVDFRRVTEGAIVGSSALLRGFECRCLIWFTFSFSASEPVLMTIGFREGVFLFFAVILIAEAVDDDGAADDASVESTG